MEIAFFPQILLRRVPEAQRAHLNGMLSAILVLLFVPCLRFVPHVCLMRTLLHVPCPGCGITHSLRALEAWHWREAWQANPAGLFLALGLLFQIAVKPFALFTTEPSAARLIWCSHQLSRLSFAALGIVWAQRIL